MAEMGAEIIKVELAPAGDLSRGFPYLRDGRSAYYVQQNRGKKSLCVDVKKPEVMRSSPSSSRKLTWWWRTTRRA